MVILPSKAFFHDLMPRWKNFNVRDQMKTKNFYMLVLFIAATSTSIWLLTNPSPSFHNIVSQTHRQINNIKNIPSNIRNSNKEADLKIDPAFLQRFGFTSTNSNVIATGVNLDSIKPVVVVSALPGHFRQVMKFVKKTHQILHGQLVLIYDLGISGSDHDQMFRYCNQTRSCALKVFDFDRLPSHVRDLDIMSYRPLVIQEALKEYKAIIWCDPRQFFITSSLNPILTIARKSGIAAWTVIDPASSTIHPKMLKYLDAEEKLQELWFLKTAKVEHLVLFNTDKIHNHLMLPWVKCALKDECISPIGSQSVGCQHDLRPRYKYTGCHGYDQAALNIILCNVFSCEYSSYAVPENVKVFGDEIPSLYSTNSTTNSIAFVSKRTQ